MQKKVSFSSDISTEVEFGTSKNQTVNCSSNISLSPLLFDEINEEKIAVQWDKYEDALSMEFEEMSNQS